MGEVIFERDGSVGVITLNAPERRNAFSPEMAAELQVVCDEIDSDRKIGAAVIRGAGGTFCAGAHLDTIDYVSTDPTEDSRFQALGAIYGAFMRVERLQTPTVAAVRGAAVGAGLNLALVTDLRVIARDARLIAGFLRIGLHPGGGYFTLMDRQVGQQVAVAMAMFGEPVSGDRARDLGLAWEAVDDKEVEARAIELAHRAAVDPALARAVSKSLRSELVSRLPLDVALEYERTAQMWSLRRRAEPEGG